MHKYFIIIAAAFALASCKDEAQIPAYVTINNFGIETDFSDEGTASSNITTAWIVANNEDLGAFELPARIPVIANGETQITVTPGMNLNGIQAYRTKYRFYNTFSQTLNLSPEQEVTLSSAGSEDIISSYRSSANVVRLEDFEGIGTNFERTGNSDTTMVTTSEPSELFPTTGLNETNTKGGKIVMRKGNSLVEFKSLTAYDLPKFGADVYLEVNIKTEVNVTFGVFANEPLQSTQSPVVTIYPTGGKWIKVYINLQPEVSGFPSAIDYNIFFGALNTDETKNKEIYIDNLKLVY